MNAKSFSLERFIAEAVTGRDNSFIEDDILVNQAELSEAIEKKRILVIGGAGSIGSSFIKAVLKFRPASLYVVDISENGLAELVRDLRSTQDQYIPEQFVLYPFSYADPVFYKMLASCGPFDIVANFAAHKHVRSEKDIFSIAAMLHNNVLNAKVLLDYFKLNPPEKFFCVSTDKAANPVNIMGASKKLMEEFTLAYSTQIQITTARFANVAFSNGSLLDSFYYRMAKGQPLSSPSDIKRYFVSPEEAGQICMCSCLLGDSGEVFFPKLEAAKMKNFADIALDFLHSFGYEPRICESENEARELANVRSTMDSWYPVHFFSTNTSGEKPYEEFFTDSEIVDLNRFVSLGVIKNAKARKLAELDEVYSDIKNKLEDTNINKAEIVNVLEYWLGNFDHIEKGMNLDSKM